MSERLPPVSDATHVNLQLAVISQQSLLHRHKVDRLSADAEEPHAALEHAKGVSAGLGFTFRRTT